jgi:hypothetical protein
MYINIYSRNLLWHVDPLPSKSCVNRREDNTLLGKSSGNTMIPRQRQNMKQWKIYFLCGPCRGCITRKIYVNCYLRVVAVRGEQVVAEVSGSSGNQSTGNIRRWKSLPSNVTEDTSLCVIVICDA